MAKRVIKEATRTQRRILIPKDEFNPDIKVIHFQHNGEDKFVPVGVVTKVPDWVIENNPKYKEYEVKL